nr:uncharacterized protein LOC112742387 [Arachis hypogaea]
MFATADAERHKGRKTTEFWNVNVIDSNGIIKQAKLSVREAIEQFFNVTNNLSLSFQKIFHFDEDRSGRIKKIILQSMGKSWKKTRGRLYDSYYKPTRTLEQNLEDCLRGIDKEHWRWFLNYRNDPDTKEKYRQNALNRSKQLYTHTGNSKSLARRREEELELQGRRVGRGELWILQHKRRNGTYIHEEARGLDKISEIEQHDESMSVWRRFQTDTKSNIPSKKAVEEEVTAEKLKRKAVNDEVAVEKLKRKAVEDDVVAEKMKRQAIESVLTYLIQWQGGELPPDITARMNSLDGHGGK